MMNKVFIVFIHSWGVEHDVETINQIFDNEELAKKAVETLNPSSQNSYSSTYRYEEFEISNTI